MHPVRHLRGSNTIVKQLEKVSCIILLLVCANFSVSVFDFFSFCCCLFYTYGKATDQPRVNGSPNPEFIQKQILKPTLHPVEFLDAICFVYKQNRGRHRKSHYLIPTEYLLKFSNFWNTAKERIPISVLIVNFIQRSCTNHKYDQNKSSYISGGGSRNFSTVAHKL